MKYTADSWFFIHLSKGTPKALEIWESIRQGKGSLIVPTIVIVEIRKRLLSHGMNKYADELIDEIESSQKILVVNLTLQIAKAAGKIGNTYNCTTADAVILATAVETEHDNLLSEDKHFAAAEKHGKIKMVRL